MPAQGISYRRLGSTGQWVSEVSFGCGRLGSAGADAKQGREAIAAALELGVNLFDTADSYGQGRSEELLGKALRDDAHALVVTKAGYVLTGKGTWLSRLKPLAGPVLRRAGWLRGAVQKTRSAGMAQDFTPLRLMGAAEASLRRLRREAIDVYLLHSPPPGVIRDAEVRAALERLREQGKIRFWGVACLEAAHGWVALEQPGIDAIQIPCGAAGAAVAHAAGLKGVAVIARQPFGSGELLKPGAMATEPGQSPAQAALEAALRMEGVSTVLAGMSCRAHVVENVRSAEIRMRVGH